MIHSEGLFIPEGRTKVPDKFFFRIGDVSDLVGVKPHVLRFWETEFQMVSPQKSKSGQRVYSKIDVENLLLIKHLLYKERYSIEGARKKFITLKRTGEMQEFKQKTVLAPAITLDSQALKKSREIAKDLVRLVSDSQVSRLFNF